MQSRARDAALAVVLLVPAVAGSAALGGSIAPSAVGVGVVATLIAEVALSRRAATVRRYWADRRVRVAAVAVGLVAVSAASVLGRWALTALASALASYVILLCAASARDRLTT